MAKPGPAVLEDRPAGDAGGKVNSGAALADLMRPRLHCIVSRTANGGNRFGRTSTEVHTRIIPEDAPVHRLRGLGYFPRE